MNLHVRDLESEVVAKLKRRAARNGRSAEAEHREILRQALGGEEDSPFWSLAAEFRERTAGRDLAPAEALVREGREER